MRIRTSLSNLVIRPLAGLGRAFAGHEDPDDRYHDRTRAWTGPFVENLEADLVSLDSILRGF